MRKAILSALVYFLLISSVYALPIVYEITGQKTTDGYGTLIGSYIYDPVSNIYYDQNLGAIYTQQPNWTSYYTIPQVTINLNPTQTVMIYTWLESDLTWAADVSGGSMPIYYLGTDSHVNINDPSLLDGEHAIRLGNLHFEGEGVTTGPAFDFGHDQYGNNYIPYASPLFSTLEHVQVPEPSSLLLLGSGIAVLGMWRRRILKHSHWGG